MQNLSFRARVLRISSFLPFQMVALQVLGTLNNLTALDLPKGVEWVDVLSNYALAPFLTKLLVPGMAQNDIVLEVRERVVFLRCYVQSVSRIFKLKAKVKPLVGYHAVCAPSKARVMTRSNIDQG